MEQEELTLGQLLDYCHHDNSKVRNRAWKRLICELSFPNGLLNISQLHLDPKIYNKAEFYETFFAEYPAHNYWEQSLFLASQEDDIELRLRILFSLMSHKGYAIEKRAKLIANVAESVTLETDIKKDYALILLEFINAQMNFYDIIPLIEADILKAQKDYAAIVPALSKLIRNLEKNDDTRKYIPQAVGIFRKMFLQEKWSSLAYEQDWSEAVSITRAYDKDLLKDTLQKNWRDNERGNVERIIVSPAFKSLSPGERAQLISGVLSQPDVKLGKISREPFWNTEMQGFLTAHIAGNIFADCNTLDVYINLLKKLTALQIAQKSHHFFETCKLLAKLILHMASTAPGYLSETVDLLISIFPRTPKDQQAELFFLCKELEDTHKESFNLESSKIIRAIFDQPGNVGIILRDRIKRPEMWEKLDMMLFSHFDAFDFSQSAFPHQLFVDALQRLKDENFIVCILIHEDDLYSRIITQVSRFVNSEYMKEEYNSVIADIYHIAASVGVPPEKTPLNKKLLQIGKERKQEVEYILNILG